MDNNDDDENNHLHEGRDDDNDDNSDIENDGKNTDDGRVVKDDYDDDVYMEIRIMIIRLVEMMIMFT